MLFICVLSVGRIGKNKKESLLTGGDMKEKEICSFHKIEFIPCIVNVTGFMDRLNYPKTKSFPISYHYNCPLCEQEHWKSVYEE